MTHVTFTISNFLSFYIVTLLKISLKYIFHFKNTKCTNNTSQSCKRGVTTARKGVGEHHDTTFQQTNYPVNPFTP